jgi:hypothetical protein
MNYKTMQPAYNNAVFWMSVKIDGRWYDSRVVPLKVKGAAEAKE